MNKRGQFFLIAALVIAGIIVALAAVNISTKTPDTKYSTLYDLSKEIDFESSSLIDYGVVRGDSTDAELGALIANYSKANPDSDVIFLYGNSEDISLKEIRDEVLSTGSLKYQGSEFTATDKKYTPTTDKPIDKSKNQVSVTLSDESVITFDLNPGENFFIVLKRVVGGEEIVAKK